MECEVAAMGTACSAQWANCTVGMEGEGETCRGGETITECEGESTGPFVYITGLTNSQYSLGNGGYAFAEVQYFFHAKILANDPEPKVLALVKQFSQPNETLLQVSSGCLWVCSEGNENTDLVALDVKQIISVVAMCPLPPVALTLAHQEHAYFVVEKLGLELFTDSVVDNDTLDNTDE